MHHIQKHSPRSSSTLFLKCLAFAIALFALVWCTVGLLSKKQWPSMNPAGHIGCQEREVDKKGNCVPAAIANVGLFGQDLDPYVDSLDLPGIPGFLARPKTTGVFPGVVMMHEWWGLNGNIKEMAKLLAKQGYVVLAVDLYGGKVATDAATAMQLSGSVRNNPQQAIDTMKKAVRYLRETEKAPAVASLGWCFGGGQSLQLALHDTLDATVLYYGVPLVTDKAQLSNIHWPVLGIFGGTDTNIPLDTIKGFEAGLNDLGVKNQIYVYQGVGHAFANPSGSTYAKEDTLDAWGKTIDFLNRTLKSSSDPIALTDPKQPFVTFSLTAEPFMYKLHGETNPTLKVHLGDYVRINLTSLAMPHDWAVDEFRVRTDKALPGTTVSAEFVADQKGTFEYYCTVPMHRAKGMVGKFIVE